MIRRWRHNSKTEHFLGWLQGFGELADSVVTLLSLGFYMSSLEITISKARAKYMIRKAKQK